MAEVRAGEVGEGREQGFDPCGLDLQGQGYLLRVAGLAAADRVGAQVVLHGGKQAVVERDPDLLQWRHLQHLRGLQAQHGAVAVGADEAARAELDATEVARDDDDDISELILFDGFEDGIPRRAARLAVVVRFLQAGVGPEHPGRAVVAGVVVFFLHGRDEGAGLVLALYMLEMRDKFRFLDFVVRRKLWCGHSNRAVCLGLLSATSREGETTRRRRRAPTETVISAARSL